MLDMKDLLISLLKKATLKLNPNLFINLKFTIFYYRSNSNLELVKAKL